jgi:predicted DNA-binding transcriptional regulator YafY
MANPFINTIKFLTAVNLLVSPSGTTVLKLMNQLKISRRTAFRLLDAMEELGFPIIDEQPKPRSEKIYRLLDSYVIKLPNLTIPNPGLIEPETELLLSILDSYINTQQPVDIVSIKENRQKIKALYMHNKNGK